MDMKEQLYILTIGKYGSLKQAAEELHLTPPALSIFLSTLERNMGVTLFDRIGKRFVPTEAGQLYLNHAKEMLDIHEQYEEKLKSLKGEFSGTIRLGIHPRRTLYLLPAAIMDFHQRHPHIHISPYEASSPEMFDALANGTLDFIITNKRNGNPYFSWTPFYEDYFVVILPADHPAVKTSIPVPGSRLRWLDLTPLKNERFILQKDFQSSRHYANNALQYFQISPSDTFVIENLETASQMAAEGFGIAFNFETYVKHFNYHKPIAYFLAGDYKQKIPYFVVTNSRKYQPGYVVDFIETLQKYV